MGLEFQIPWKMRKPPGVGTGPTRTGVLVGESGFVAPHYPCDPCDPWL